MLVTLAFIVLLSASVVAIRRRHDPRFRYVGLGLAVLALLALVPGIGTGLVFQKLVGLILMPVGIIWALMLACAWGVSAFGDLRYGAVFWVLLSLWTLAGSPVIGGWLLWSLERDFAPFAVDELEAFDAIYVLGGGTSVSPRGRALVGESGERVILAVHLYHRGLTSRLIASGSSISGLGAVRDASAETRDIWVSLQVPESSIRMIPQPRNTSEELQAYAGDIRSRGYGRVGIVTSAWHMRRAMRLAEKNQIEVTPLPADFRSRPAWDGLFALIPTGTGFRDVHTGCWEYLGALVGR